MKQEQATNNKSTWWQMIRPITLLLLTVLLFSYVTYSWLNRQWTPSIKQEGITISTSSSLVFLLDHSGETTSSMRIDQILDLDQDFVLRPVSNATGLSTDFFTLNMSGEEKDYFYQHITPPDTGITPDYSQLGIENGYIEFNMALGSTDNAPSTQYIYLHPDSHIKFHGEEGSEQSTAVNCIRVSITINTGSDSNLGETVIFVPNTIETNKHSGVSPENDYMMDGAMFYDENGQRADKHDGKDIVIFAKDNVKHLTDCMAGYKKGTDGQEDTYAPTEDNTLFTLNVDPNSSAPVWITVRIWAEGTDPICEDPIAGQQIDLMLKFAAIRKQEP